MQPSGQSHVTRKGAPLPYGPGWADLFRLSRGRVQSGTLDFQADSRETRLGPVSSQTQSGGVRPNNPSGQTATRPATHQPPPLLQPRGWDLLVQAAGKEQPPNTPEKHALAGTGGSEAGCVGVEGGGIGKGGIPARGFVFSAEASQTDPAKEASEAAGLKA